MLSYSIQDVLFRFLIVRWLVAIVVILRGAVFIFAGRLYRAMNEFSWVARVSDVAPLRNLAESVIRRVLESIKKSGRNTIVDSYRSDSISADVAALYSITSQGSKDIFRDLIVLKRAREREMGVILLKYARTFDAVVSLFDVTRLMERYVVVLEPCWAGYCDPSILMFVAPGRPVVVQCFTQDDFEFIASIGSPLVPVRLGPADWVDADVFRPSPPGLKCYDLVMVANWAPHKRHAQLFRTLTKIKNREIRVLLVGFEWAGWTIDDIRQKAASVQNELVHIEFLERIAHRELAGYLSQCKVFVFLSRKEGDNKSLVEAMFANVPAIVFDKTVGGAKSRINSDTGILSSDEELSEKIIYMLDNYQEFAPRTWALRHTGSSVAARILNETVRDVVVGSGLAYSEDIVEKINSPNLAYKDPSCRPKFQADYEFIISCRRSGGSGHGL
jgi:glycosyltransferase involved in cell wall biosynthesis